MSTQGTGEHEEFQGDESAEENRELSLFQNGGTQQLLQWHGMDGNYGEGVECHVPTQQQLLESCSAIQLLQNQNDNNEAAAAEPQWPTSHGPPFHHATAFGRTQEIQFRELGSPALAPNNFYAPSLPSSYQIPNTPQCQLGGYMGVHPNYYLRDMEDSPSRDVRMRMTVEDNRVPRGGQLHVGTTSFDPLAAQASESPKPPRAMRNTVYDPMYEDMGLPVDPHLRMFLAKRNQGKD